MKKKTIYCRPEEGKEEFVRHLFSRHAEEWGFEILNIQKKFPDCTAIDKRKTEERIVNIEFEYSAKNYDVHGHDSRMLKNPTIIVCWNKNATNIKGVKEIISLKEKQYGIDIKKYPKEISTDDSENNQPKYYVLNYNPKYAGEREIEEWVNVNCFRVNPGEGTSNKFAGNLPAGSKILLHQAGKIVAGFTVVRYVIIEPPSRTQEKEFFKLYAQLMNYPTTLYTSNEKEHKNEYWSGHIFYTDFFIFERACPKYNMGPRAVVRKLTETEYDNLVG